MRYVEVVEHTEHAGLDGIPLRDELELELVL